MHYSIYYKIKLYEYAHLAHNVNYVFPFSPPSL